MEKKTLLVTGASGNMGSEVLKQTMDTGRVKGVVLLRKKTQLEVLFMKKQAFYFSRSCIDRRLT